MIPPCTFPLGPERTRCGEPALYGFRLTAWPTGRKAPVCPAHAIATRLLHGDQLEAMWSIRPWRAPVPPARKKLRGYRSRSAGYLPM